MNANINCKPPAASFACLKSAVAICHPVHRVCLGFVFCIFKLHTNTPGKKKFFPLQLVSLILLVSTFIVNLWPDVLSSREMKALVQKIKFKFLTCQYYPCVPLCAHVTVLSQTGASYPSLLEPSMPDLSCCLPFFGSLLSDCELRLIWTQRFHLQFLLYKFELGLGGVQTVMQLKWCLQREVITLTVTQGSATFCLAKFMQCIYITDDFLSHFSHITECIPYLKHTNTARKSDDMMTTCIR